MFWVSLVAQMVKNQPAMWETWVRSLSWEDLLEKGTATQSSILAWRISWTVELMVEKEMATHSTILAWRIPMDRGAWRATVHGTQRVKQG